VVVVIIPGRLANYAAEPKHDVLGSAIEKGVNKILVQFEIDDDLDRQFLLEALKFKQLGSPDTINITVLRPADKDKVHDTKRFDIYAQPSSIEWTKIDTATVRESMAIIVYTGVQDGTMASEKRVIVANKKGELQHIMPVNKK